MLGVMGIFKKRTGGIIMPHRFRAVLLFVGILASACAAHRYRPIVDFQGKTRQQYEIELQE